MAHWSVSSGGPSRRTEVTVAGGGSSHGSWHQARKTRDVVGAAGFKGGVLEERLGEAGLQTPRRRSEVTGETHGGRLGACTCRFLSWAGGRSAGRSRG